MAKLQVILTVGLPASGKSTWAKAHVKEHNGWKRINKDDLRAMLDDSKWSKENEGFVIQARDSLVTVALEQGFNVVVDDTNFSDKHKTRLEAIAKQLSSKIGKEIEVSVKDFTHVPVQECIRRDKLRDKPVTEKVILNMYNQYLKQKPCVALQDPKKPKAVVFDIDGTIADHEGVRGHYDKDMYLEDRVVHHVAKHLGFYMNEGTKVVILTARDEAGRVQTEQWLEKHELPHDSLIMRKEGDSRSDYIAKKEMLLELMKTNFVEACYEDRLRNVNMMRGELGLNVFHVADGLF